MSSTDASAIPIKNNAYRISFPILDNDGDLVSGASGLDSEISKDGANPTDCTNEATEIGSSGMYYLDLTSTEMNADTVVVIIKTSTTGAKTTPIVLYPVLRSDTVSEVSGSEVAIVNIALSHLGVGKEIANLVTEQSEEAECARRLYGTARDATLRDFPWPFATTIATLALIEEDPNDEWAYSYRYPTDCLYLRRILSGIRNDYRQSRVSYKIAQDSGGSLIYTDQGDAQIEYTARVTDPTRYPQDFVIMLSLYLAALIAPRLAGGDPHKLGDRAMKMYYLELSKAVSRAANEEQAEEAPVSEFERARN